MKRFLKFIIALLLNPFSATIATFASLIVALMIILAMIFPISVPKEYKSISLENCQVTDVISTKKQIYKVSCN